MLRWRLLLGTLVIAFLVGLCWLDHLAAVPGVWLLPVAALLTVAAGAEMIHLAGRGGLRPLPWVVHGGNLLLLASSWVPMVCRHCAASVSLQEPMARRECLMAGWSWPLFALAVGTLLIFLGEMVRYEKPGRATANAGAAALALIYIGVMLSFVVQLRMIWGVGALASLVIVVKLSDTGAYFVGKLVGRHKLAPVLSPGKTVEGALGGLVLGCLGSWATFAWLVPLTLPAGTQAGPWWGWIAFGALLSVAGLLGDLAESLLKRDVGCKDSSSWMPGFGGVLDMLDSILLAAPAAWLAWASGLVV